MSHTKKLLALSLIVVFAYPAIVHAATLGEAENQPTIVKLNKVEFDEESAEAAPKTFKAVMVAKAKDIEAGGPWLGIQFGPLPKPLATHLDIESGVGQIVLNVVEDSPADRAGLKQHDVIVGIDGDKVSSNMGEFLDVVRGFAPNETHSFSMLRDGEDVQADITIGTRPDSVATTKYKFEILADEHFGGKLFQRGGFLEKDEDGKWNFRRFDQLDDMPDIWKYMPQIDDEDIAFSWHGDIPGLSKRMNIFVDRSRQVQIERNEDGQITVTSIIEEDGDKTTTTNTYANEEEFKRNDPETYEAHKNHFHFDFSKHLDLHKLGLQGLHGGVFLNKDGDNFEIDVDVNVDEILEQAQKAWKLHAADPKKLRDLHGKRYKAFFVHKPKTTFEVNPDDGSIRVITRKGESELIETYDSADQLQEAKPELYDLYEDLQDVQVEGAKR